MVRVHVGPVPLHAPTHPVKVSLPVARAISVTTVPAAKDAVQTLPQSIPGGALVTVPSPETLTASAKLCGAAGSNAAVTDFGPSMMSAQPAAPKQAPVQPRKTKPGAGAAESVTVSPTGNVAEHVLPQSIPGGALVTVPVPSFATASAAP